MLATGVGACVLATGLATLGLGGAGAVAGTISYNCQITDNVVAAAVSSYPSRNAEIVVTPSSVPDGTPQTITLNIGGDGTTASGPSVLNNGPLPAAANAFQAIALVSVDGGPLTNVVSATTHGATAGNAAVFPNGWTASWTNTFAVGVHTVELDGIVYNAASSGPAWGATGTPTNFANAFSFDSICSADATDPAGNGGAGPPTGTTAPSIGAGDQLNALATEFTVTGEGPTGTPTVTVTVTATETVPGPTVTATTTVPGPTVTSTVTEAAATVTATVTEAAATVTATETVPGPTVTSTVTEAAATVTATVTEAAATVTATETVPGPTVTATTTVPGPTVTSTETVAGPTTTITQPGPTVTATETVAGPTTTVTSPGPTVTVTATNGGGHPGDHCKDKHKKKDRHYWGSHPGKGHGHGHDKWCDKPGKGGHHGHGGWYRAADSNSGSSAGLVVLLLAAMTGLAGTFWVRRTAAPGRHR